MEFFAKKLAVQLDYKARKISKKIGYKACLSSASFADILQLSVHVTMNITYTRFIPLRFQSIVSAFSELFTICVMIWAVD